MEATPQVSPQRFAIANAVISTAAVGFLVWLVYFHRGGSSAGASVLPTCNALLNTTSGVVLWLARRAIIRGDRQRHQRLMYIAFASSTLFLATYIYYHYSHGDTAFAGGGAIRVVYFALLISHVGFSIVVLPMIFTSFFLALTIASPSTNACRAGPGPAGCMFR